MKVRFPAILLLILLFSCSIPKQEREDVTFMRLATTVGVQHPHAKAAEYFARLVERHSEGNMKVEVRPSGKDGDSIQNLEQLSFGGLSIIIIDSDMLLNAFPELSEVIHCYREASNPEAFLISVNEQLSGHGIIALTCYGPKTRGIFSSRYDVDDLASLEVGTVGGRMYLELIQEDGMSARTVKLGDSAGILADFSIDAIEAPIVDFASTDAYMFSHDVFLPDYERMPTLMLMNRRIFLSLDEQEKKNLLKDAELSRYYADTLLRRAEETLMTRLRKEKNVIEEGELDV